MYELRGRPRSRSLRNPLIPQAKFRVHAGRNSPGHGESCAILHSDKQTDRIAPRHESRRDASSDAAATLDAVCRRDHSSKDNDVYRRPIDFTSAAHYPGLGAIATHFGPSITANNPGEISRPRASRALPDNSCD